jgi:hypothetical protein
MKKKEKPTAPKSPAKRVKVSPTKSKGDELGETELKGVAGGMAPKRVLGCTCSNMPSDPG